MFFPSKGVDCKIIALVEKESQVQRGRSSRTKRRPGPRATLTECRVNPKFRNNFRSTFVPSSINHVVLHHCKMFTTKTLARSRCLLQPFGARNFSSSPISARLSLAYDFYEAAKPETKNAPIVFIHGLFGSKKNNRSMSKSEPSLVQ